MNNRQLEKKEERMEPTSQQQQYRQPVQIEPDKPAMTTKAAQGVTPGEKLPNKPTVGEMLHTLFRPPENMRRIPANQNQNPAPKQDAAPAAYNPKLKQDLPTLLAAQAQKVYNPNMPPIPIGIGALSKQQPNGNSNKSTPSTPSHNSTLLGQGEMPQTKAKPPTVSMMKQGTTASMDLSDNWGNPKRIGSAGT